MNPVDEAVDAIFPDVVAGTDTATVNAALQRIAADPACGVGIAVLVAWRQGLAVGHLPTEADPPRHLAASASCPYTAVHVPIRRFRSRHDELARRGILARHPDPARLAFHEDALITPAVLDTLREPADLSGSPGLSADDVRAVLDHLTAAGVLVAAAPDDPRIRCTAGAERPDGPVYLPVAGPPPTDPSPTDPSRAGLPATLDAAGRARVVALFATRRPCTYCSGTALNPREATVRARVPGAVRTYRFGFTFAPVGDPREVCHVLAWDDPPAGTPVLDMNPAPFSASDLTHLVRAVDADVERFARSRGLVAPPALVGACNHRAGNSIHHQHYQFFRLPDLPLLAVARSAARAGRRHRGQGVHVTRLGDRWPCPAYVVTGAGPDDVGAAADRLALAWHRSSDDHTTNLLVTGDRDLTLAVVVPRLRSRVDTSVTSLPGGTTLRKGNAAVLELAGYFVIDDPAHFDALASLPAARRRLLADSWLAELAPDPADVAAFEREVETAFVDDAPRGAGQR